MTAPWKRRYAQRTKQMGSSIIRELLKLTQQPDLISFAGGLPAPEIFPVDRCNEAASRVLQTHSAQALQYSTTEGYLPLRELIAEKMNRTGLRLTPDNVLITSGAQQGLDIIGKVLIDPGDVILTERPTYLGAIQAWKAYQADFITIPIDENGLCIDERLAEALRAGPKFMYVLPNFQNPGGVTLSLERRKKLIEIADYYGIPIIEDDPYSDLRYEGEDLPPLILLDSEWQKGHSRSKDDRGDVIYLGTFSKTFAPGLRLGWMAAPTAVIKKCVQAKQGVDLHTSTFNQMLLHEIAKDSFLDQHREVIRKVYKERRDIMLAAMAQYMPPGVQWTDPAGGLFLWATLPEEMDAQLVFEQAIANKVAFVPGEAFYPREVDNPEGSRIGQNTMRLNFSNSKPEMIELGIKRLGEAIKKCM